MDADDSGFTSPVKTNNYRKGNLKTSPTRRKQHASERIGISK